MIEPRTEWYPISLRPVRRGWYEIQFWLRHPANYSPIVRRYWTGKIWSLDDRSIGLRIDLRPGDQWRGLAK